MKCFYKVAIFDFDDTLMATKVGRVAALTKALSDFGYHVTEDGIDSNWGKPFDQLISSLAPNIDYKSFYKHYSKIMLGFPPVVQPGVIEVLQFLKANIIPIYVVSSGSRDLVIQDLERGDIAKFINKLWCFEDTEYHKPDPRTLKPIIGTLETNGILPRDAVYIGDSLSDYHVARENDINFIAVLSGMHKYEDFRGAGLRDENILVSLQELL